MNTPRPSSNFVAGPETDIELNCIWFKQTSNSWIRVQNATDKHDYWPSLPITNRCKDQASCWEGRNQASRPNEVPRLKVLQFAWQDRMLGTGGLSPAWRSGPGMFGKYCLINVWQILHRYWQVPDFSLRFGHHCRGQQVLFLQLTSRKQTNWTLGSAPRSQVQNSAPSTSDRKEMLCFCEFRKSLAAIAQLQVKFRSNKMPREYYFTVNSE